MNLTCSNNFFVNRETGTANADASACTIKVNRSSSHVCPSICHVPNFLFQDCTECERCSQNRISVGVLNSWFEHSHYNFFVLYVGSNCSTCPDSSLLQLALLHWQHNSECPLESKEENILQVKHTKSIFILFFNSNHSQRNEPKKQSIFLIKYYIKMFINTLFSFLLLLVAFCAAQDSAHDIQVGLQGLMEAAKDPALLAQLVRDMQVWTSADVKLIDWLVVRRHWMMDCLRFVALSNVIGFFRVANEMQLSWIVENMSRGQYWNCLVSWANAFHPNAKC